MPRAHAASPAVSRSPRAGRVRGDPGLRAHRRQRAFGATLAGLALVASVVAEPAAAADAARDFAPWRWVEFTTTDGLPCSQVLDVVETENGVPWALTRAGVAWYDGFRWNAVRDMNGRALAGATSLAIDGAGLVWVIADSRVYRGGRRGFERIRLPGGRARPLGVACDRRTGGTLVLLGTGDRLGLRTILQLDGSAVMDVVAPCDGHDCALVSTDAAIWAETRGGASRRTGPSWRTLLIDGRPARSYMIDESPTAGGLAAVHAPEATFELWEWEPGAPARIVPPASGVAVRALTVSDSRAVVLLDDGRVLVRDGSWAEIASPPRELAYARRLRLRANGDLWAFGRAGLFLCRTSAALWRQWPASALAGGERVHEIIETGDGAAWIASAGGVERRDATGATLTLPPPDPAVPPIVTGLAVAEDGSIWASSGSAFAGVRRWDGAQWSAIRADATGAALGLLHKIRRGADGTLWLLGLATDVEQPYDLEGSVYTVRDGVIRRWDRGKPFAGQRVVEFVEGPDGARWFLTNNRVLRTDTSGEVSSIRVVHEHSWGPYGLAVDGEGTAWVSIDQGGLVRLDADGNLSDEELPAGFARTPVWSLGIDVLGRIWAATADGVLVRGRYGWRMHDDETGLGGGRYWALSLTATRALVGSRTRGVWELPLAASTAPPLRVDVSVRATAGHGVRASWTPRASWRGAAHLDVRTRARLDGGAWSKWSDTREAHFDALAEGVHVLEVEAAGEGELYRGAARWTVTRAPSLTERPEFLFAVATPALALAVLFVIHRRRRRRDASTIRAHYEHYLSIIDEASDAIVVCDTDGRVLEANRSFAALASSDRDSILGRPFGELVDIAALSGEPLFPWAGRPERTAALHCRIEPNGAPTAVHLEIAAQVMTIGVVLLVMRDVSARVDMERELRRSANIEHELRVAVEHAQRRHRAVSARLVQVEERARARLARELHDEIGQDLTGVKLILEAIRGGDTDGDRVLQAMRILSVLQDRVRRLALRLRPSLLDDLGLAPAIAWNIGQFAEQSDVVISFEHAGLAERLPAEVEITAYRIVQAALTNALRHARATTVAVSVRREDAGLVIVVRDDGVGFELDATTARTGLGVAGMRERAYLVGGDFDLQSAPGVGTVVRATLPTQPECAEPTADAAT